METHQLRSHAREIAKKHIDSNTDQDRDIPKKRNIDFLDGLLCNDSVVNRVFSKVGCDYSDLSECEQLSALNEISAAYEREIQNFVSHWKNKKPWL